MKLSGNSRAGLLLVATLGAVWAAACSDDDGPNGINELGGSTYGGGTTKSTSGGSSNVGGASVVQGGTIGNGGSTVVNSAGSGATPTSGGTTAVTTITGGSTSVGGTATAGAPTAGAGGGTAACGTTKGSFAFLSATPTALNGFAKFVPSSNANPNPVVDTVTSPAICADGCIRVAGTFAAGDAAYKKVVAIQKALTGDYSNLLGAKVVVKMAVEGLTSAVPIWLSLYSQGTNGSWGSVGMDNQGLASYNGVFAEYVWDVKDMSDYANKQFCAASTTNIGLMLQTGGSVTAAGTVSIYIKSIEIRPSGYVPQGAGGSAGSAGAPSTLTAGNAGTAGSN